MQVLDWSRAQVALMKPDAGTRALNAIIRDLVDTQDGATYFAGRVWGVNTHYSLGGSHPLVGYSVPNFELGNGTLLGELMQDGKGILLDFTTDASLKTVADGYSSQVKYVAGPAKEQLGMTAVLVRPDGIIAWACEGRADLGELKEAAERWFVEE
jgi:hypothetical protein